MKKIKGIIKMVKMVDMFGTPIKFNIDGKDKYQSFVGGLTTLVMIALIILFFQSQIRNFFNRTKLRSEQLVQFNSQPLPLNLDYSNFLFAIRIDQPSEYPFNERPFFNIKMTQFNQTRDGLDTDRDDQIIELEPCNQQLFSDFKSQGISSESLFKKFNFDRFLCPKKDYELYLEGAYLNEFFRFIKIEVTECVGNNCAPKSVVEEYLEENNEMTLSLYTSNFVINPDHNDNYAQFYLAEDLHFNFEPSKTKKEVNVFFKSYDIETDMSLFINEDFQSENYIFREEGNYKESTVYKRENLDESPLTIFFRSDYLRYVATRRFQKVDELLSYFGGIFQLFLLVFGLFVTFYNEKYLKLSLANKLYDFVQYQDDKPDDQNDEEFKIKSIIKKKPSQVKDDEKNKGNDQEDVKVHDEDIELQEKNKADINLKDITDMEKLKQLGFKSRKEFIQAYFVKILTKKHHARFSVQYILYVITCKKKFGVSRSRQIEKGILMIEKDMNVKTILQRGQQVDKLKKLLLNSNQLVLFNFYPKPIVDENVETIQISQSGHLLGDRIQKEIGEEQQTDYDAFLTLLQAYEELMKNWSEDESTQMVNKKLINLLGSELRNVFKISLLIQALDKDDNSKKLFRQQRTIKQKFEEEIADEERELEEIRQALYKNLKTEGKIEHQDLEEKKLLEK